MSATVRVKRFIIIEVSVKRESTVMWNDKSKLITVGAWRANILIFSPGNMYGRHTGCHLKARS